ncbi:MAG: glycerate kinase [Coriobacteriaceae bacterium]|nr:glycerate kinase [Coriobacteriaceae bacterium]
MPMQRFLFASDSFKGSLSSARAAELLREAALAAFPAAQTRMLEVADGGEGTVSAVTAAVGGQLRTACVKGPLGEPVPATYGLLDGNRAIIEMAAASGLPLVHPANRNPLLTSTYGTGQLILDALDQGVHDISLAIGGSATNDGGMGCLRALGARFLDADGRELEGRGADLSRVCAIDMAGLDKRLAAARFRVMCDVDNPLLGPQGATRIFGAQKGGTPEALDQLEAGMHSYARTLARTFPGFDPMAPGMGAAGGLGAAARAFLHAEALPGVECVLDLVGFDELLEGCSLCVTGEGHADAQSAHGKVISGIAARCKNAGVPCVAVVGGMDASAEDLLELGIEALIPTVPDICTIDEAMENAERNYRMAANRLFSLIKLGSALA